MTKSVIKFENVSKGYRIGSGRSSLRDVMARVPRRLFGRNNSQTQAATELWALKDASFEVRQGEAIGLIGPNGAGKSTTLKLIAGITQPTTGQIEVTGRISSLIELGAGFHPDLTGRENVYLNGTILGLSRKEIDRKFDRIVAFAELEKFIDTPVKRYSSGMYARLGFAVAIHAEPEILLVDEVLAVGDYAFQTKCLNRMTDIRKQGTTLLFVSHNLQAVAEVCERVLLLSSGRMQVCETPQEAFEGYYTAMSGKLANAASADQQAEYGIERRIVKGGAKIVSVELFGENGLPSRAFRPSQTATVEVMVEFEQDAEDPIPACYVKLPSGLVVYDITTRYIKATTGHFQAGTRCVLKWHMEMNLLAGQYQVGVDMAYGDLSGYYDKVENALIFLIYQDQGALGLADLRATLEFQTAESHPAADHNLQGQ